MTELQASRTLVKSPPELWAECSDAASLARHLDRFGEIRITRLEPETAVAWEGERARGTVRIEPAGWGTKVILTAVAEVRGSRSRAREPVAPRSPAPPRCRSAGAGRVEEPVVAETPADELEPRRRRFARLRAFLRGPEPAPDAPGVAPPPTALTDPPAPEPPPAAESPTHRRPSRHRRPKRHRHPTNPWTRSQMPRPPWPRPSTASARLTTARTREPSPRPSRADRPTARSGPRSSCRPPRPRCWRRRHLTTGRRPGRPAGCRRRSPSRPRSRR